MQSNKMLKGLLMKRVLLHYMACQADGRYPMDLYVFKDNYEVISGILFCPICSRWYPIKGGLPEILPDQSRKAKGEKAFLKRWIRLLPKKVLISGKPFNLEKTRH
jgi:uncharacterized protein YbaR (Trm112 family)